MHEAHQRRECRPQGATKTSSEGAGAGEETMVRKIGQRDELEPRSTTASEECTKRQWRRKVDSRQCSTVTSIVKLSGTWKPRTKACLVTMKACSIMN